MQPVVEMIRPAAAKMALDGTPCGAIVGYGLRIADCERERTRARFSLLAVLLTRSGICHGPRKVGVVRSAKARCSIRAQWLHRFDGSVVVFHARLSRTRESLVYCVIINRT
jgi:hypothetical protein